MVEKSVKESILKYIIALQASQVPVAYAVVFGSQASGKATPISDIDVVIVSPKFDTTIERSDISNLWKIAARVDSRIEPVPCGVKQWDEDDSSIIIELARTEGEIIRAA